MTDNRHKLLAVYQLIDCKTGEKSDYYTATYASEYVLGVGRRKQKFVRESYSTIYAADMSRQPKYVRPMFECPELIESTDDFESKWKLIGGISLRDTTEERNKRVDAAVSRMLLK